MSSYNASSNQIYHNPKYSAMDIMQRAKARLIESSVGMAGMLLQLELIEDNSFDTMATDGKVIKFNANFVLSLPNEEITAVIIHETLHVVWGHHLRMGRRMLTFGILLVIMQSTITSMMYYVSLYQKAD